VVSEGARGVSVLKTMVSRRRAKLSACVPSAPDLLVSPNAVTSPGAVRLDIRMSCAGPTRFQCVVDEGEKSHGIEARPLG